MQRLAFGIAGLSYDDYLQMSLRQVWNAAKPKIDQHKADQQLLAHYMTFVANPIRKQLHSNNELLSWKDIYPFEVDTSQGQMFSEEWKQSLREKHEYMSKRREEIFGTSNTDNDKGTPKAL